MFSILGLIVFISLILYADYLEIEGLSKEEIMIVCCIIGIIAFGIGIMSDIIIFGGD